MNQFESVVVAILILICRKLGINRQEIYEVESEMRSKYAPGTPLCEVLNMEI